jgi:hypothetical protein
VELAQTMYTYVSKCKNDKIQVWSPEFKPQCHQEKNGKIKGEKKKTQMSMQWNNTDVN